MNDQRTHYKRRQYLINPGFQLKFMMYIALAVLSGLTVLYASNFFYYDLLITEGRDIGLNPDHPYFEFVDAQRKLLTSVYLITSFLVFSMLMIFGLFLSHRIAGPIYRLETYMNRIRNGEDDLGQVYLREGDFFPELADIINGLVWHYTEEPRQGSGSTNSETPTDSH